MWRERVNEEGRRDEADVEHTNNESCREAEVGSDAIRLRLGSRTNEGAEESAVRAHAEAEALEARERREATVCRAQ